MAEVTKDTYLRIIENRPFKLSPEEAGYEPADADYRCRDCMHFFTRRVDGFNVCEIVRPDDDEVESIIPNYKCKFWTSDGEEHPLLEE